MLTADNIKSQARLLGFDLCGIAPAEAHPELSFLESWLSNGYAGEMHYLSRTADRRSDVRKIMPTARSVVVLGTNYNTNAPYSTEVNDSSRAMISRYGWGKDYHEVVGRRTQQLLVWMRDHSDEPFEAKAYVDSGPIQERVYAQHAGIGWIGKNTCLINSEIGSWLFLSEIVCSLLIETDVPALDQCGTCSLCLEACPTDAIVEPWVLDATRCISYFTIETKTEIPESFRSSVGSHVYGCDICQDVCPWNAGALESETECWQPHAEFDRPYLTDLWEMDDEKLELIIAQSPISYTGLQRFRRNIAVALGNSGSRKAGVVLSETEENSSRNQPLVVDHVKWARQKLAIR